MNKNVSESYDNAPVAANAKASISGKVVDNRTDESLAELLHQLRLLK